MPEINININVQKLPALSSKSSANTSSKINKKELEQLGSNTNRQKIGSSYSKKKEAQLVASLDESADVSVGMALIYIDSNRFTVINKNGNSAFVGLHKTDYENYHNTGFAYNFDNAESVLTSINFSLQGENCPGADYNWGPSKWNHLGYAFRADKCYSCSETDPTCSIGDFNYGYARPGSATTRSGDYTIDYAILPIDSDRCIVIGYESYYTTAAAYQFIEIGYLHTELSLMWQYQYSLYTVGIIDSSQSSSTVKCVNGDAVFDIESGDCFYLHDTILGLSQNAMAYKASSVSHGGYPPGDYTTPFEIQCTTYGGGIECLENLPTPSIGPLGPRNWRDITVDTNWYPDYEILYGGVLSRIPYDFSACCRQDQTFKLFATKAGRDSNDTLSRSTTGWPGSAYGSNPALAESHTYEQIFAFLVSKDTVQRIDSGNFIDSNFLTDFVKRRFGKRRFEVDDFQFLLNLTRKPFDFLATIDGPGWWLMPYFNYPLGAGCFTGGSFSSDNQTVNVSNYLSNKWMMDTPSSFPANELTGIQNARTARAATDYEAAIKEDRFPESIGFDTRVANIDTNNISPGSDEWLARHRNASDNAFPQNPGMLHAISGHPESNSETSVFSPMEYYYFFDIYPILVNESASSQDVSINSSDFRRAFKIRTRDFRAYTKTITGQDGPEKKEFQTGIWGLAGKDITYLDFCRARGKYGEPEISENNQSLPGFYAVHSAGAKNTDDLDKYKRSSSKNVHTRQSIHKGNNGELVNAILPPGTNINNLKVCLWTDWGRPSACKKFANLIINLK